MAESSEEIYIGGQPSASGTLDGWRSAVKNNPMPIYYRMSLISDLFDKVLESDEDVATAKTQFNAGLVTYCESLNCSGNFVDLDLPTA